MPFTGSHPAAILPFVRTGLPASALVIGAMSPDLIFFGPEIPNWPTHAWWAVATIDAALGLVAWAVWHVLFVAPLLDAAPSPLRARLAGIPVGLRPRLATWKAGPAVVAAVILGAATHVLWDEFTHHGRFGDRHIGVLHATWGPEPGWHWAQYASTVVGLAVLSLWFIRWWQRTPADPLVGPGLLGRSPSRYRMAVTVLVAATAVAGAVAALRAISAEGAVRALGFSAITNAIGAMAAVAALFAVAWHVWAVFARRDVACEAPSLRS